MKEMLRSRVKNKVIQVVFSEVAEVDVDDMSDTAGEDYTQERFFVSDEEVEDATRNDDSEPSAEEIVEPDTSVPSDEISSVDEVEKSNDIEDGSVDILLKMKYL